MRWMVGGGERSEAKSTALPQEIALFLFSPARSRTSLARSLARESVSVCVDHLQMDDDFELNLSFEPVNKAPAVRKRAWKEHLKKPAQRLATPASTGDTATTTVTTATSAPAPFSSSDSLKALENISKTPLRHRPNLLQHRPNPLQQQQRRQLHHRYQLLHQHHGLLPRTRTPPPKAPSVDLLPVSGSVRAPRQYRATTPKTRRQRRSSQHLLRTPRRPNSRALSESETMLTTSTATLMTVVQMPLPVQPLPMRLRELQAASRVAVAPELPRQRQRRHPLRAAPTRAT